MLHFLSKRGFQVSRRGWVAASLLVILGIVAAIRIRLLNLPLERDEGEFAYAAQLLLQGVSPYDWAYTVMLKLPGTFVMYAISMAIFGQTTAGIHAGLILVNLASVLLVFVLARRICGDAAGVVAAGTFAFLSIIPATLGLAAHATHFIVLFALAGIVLLQNLDEHTSSARIFWGGWFLGLAFLMEQLGAPFGLFAAVWILRQEFSFGQRQWLRLAKRLGWLAVGGLSPFLLTCLIVALAGDFNRFWFWAFTYAAAHGEIFNFKIGMIWMLAKCWRQFTAASGLWGMAILGLPLLFCVRSLRRWRFFVASFALFSFLAVCPGWYFRDHYFIQLLPAAGLLAGVAFQPACDFFARRKLGFAPATLPAIIFVAAAASSLIQWNGIYFRLTPDQACRAVYSINPFPEAVVVGRYLEAHCPPDARIAVIGSEPEIFFYSRRRSATGHICTYPLVENQPYAAQMRSEMIQEIEKANPEYVVCVNVRWSWVQSTAKMDPTIFEWFDKYQSKHLKLVGLVEIYPDQPTKFRWFGGEGKEVDAVQTTAESWLAIFRWRGN